MAVEIQELRAVVSAELKNFASTLRRAQNQVQSFRTVVTNVGAAARATGAALTRIGVVGAIAAAKTLKTFADFEETMVRVGAVTRATAEDFERLNEAAKEAGRTTRFTAIESAEAMEQLGLAGLSVNEVLTALPKTLELASAAQISISDAAKIASKNMRAFGLEATDISRVNDALTATFTRSNTNILQLQEGLKLVGGVAAQAGLSIEETTAILGKMADVGVDATRAGTSLRFALSAMAAPAAEAAKKLEEFGVVAGDDFFDILQKVEVGIEDVIDPMERLGVVTTIFGLRAAPGMLKVLDEGADGIREFANETTNLAGITADLNAKNLTTMAAKFDLLKSAIVGVFIEAGEQGANQFKQSIENLTATIIENQEALQQLISGFINLIGALVEFVAMHPQIASLLALFAVSNLLGITAAITAWGKAILSLRKAMIATDASLLGFVARMQRMATLIAVGGPIIIGLAAIASAVWVWRKAQKAINESIEATNRLLDAQKKRLDEGQAAALAGGRGALEAELARKRELLKLAEKQFIADTKSLEVEEAKIGAVERRFNKTIGLDPLAGLRENVDTQRELFFGIDDQVKELENALSKLGDDVATDAVATSVGTATADGVQAGITTGAAASMTELEEMLAEASASAIERTAPGTREIMDLISQGANAEQLRKFLTNQAISAEGELTPSAAGGIDSAINRFSQNEALGLTSGEQGPGSIAVTAQKMAEALEAARIAADEALVKGREVAQAEAEVARIREQGLESFRSQFEALKALPEEVGGEIGGAMRDLFHQLDSGQISAETFTNTMAFWVGEVDKATEAAQRSAAAERQKALIAGDFKGAGLNFGQAVQQGFQQQAAQFQQGRFDQAVQQMVDRMLRLNGFIKPVADNFRTLGGRMKKFGEGLTNVNKTMDGFRPASGQDAGKVIGAIGTLGAFLNSRQGQIAVLKNNIALLQQTLPLIRDALRRRQIEADIMAMMQQIRNLLNVPPPAISALRQDPAFTDPGLSQEEDDSGRQQRGRGQTINVTVNSLFPPDGSAGRMLLDAIEQEQQRRGWRNN